MGYLKYVGIFRIWLHFKDIINDFLKLAALFSKVIEGKLFQEILPNSVTDRAAGLIGCVEVEKMFIIII